MNNQYERVLTPSVARELIQELFARRTVQLREIKRTVDEVHAERGGQPPNARWNHPVTHALSSMKRVGLAENPKRGTWTIFSVKPPRSEDSSKSEESSQIESLMEFIKWVEGLPSGKYVFRGVSNEDYPIEASTYRRLKDENGRFRNEEDKSAERLLQINAKMIEDANSRRHGWENDQRPPHLNLLAKLQHNGAATCLIDFTKNPLVALWMACRKSGKGSVRGKVNAVDISSRSPFKLVSSDEALNRKINHFFQGDEKTGYQLYQWQPHYQDKRMLAQQSVFLFGGDWGAIKPSVACVRSEQHKQEIWDSLKKSAGISEDTLFPDFEGFASQRAQNKAYNESDVPDDWDVVRDTSQEDERDEVESDDEQNEQAALHYLEIGRQAVQEGDPDQAIRYYSDGIVLGPPNMLLSDLFRERAAVYYSKYDFEHAVNDYCGAIRHDSTSGHSYYWRGMARYKLYQYPEAMSDFDHAISRDFNKAYSYYWRGMANCDLERYPESISDFERAIELDSTNTYFYHWRGVATTNLGSHQDAIVYFNQAIRLNPAHVYSYHWRGIAEYNLNQYPQAIADFNQAISRNLTDRYFKGHSYYWRGTVKKDLSIFDDAIRDFRTALDFARESENHELIGSISEEFAYFKEMGYGPPED